jgi:hypothetical protein
MAKTKTYKVGNEVYDIPENETQEFLSSFKDAVEVESYIVGKDTFDIPLAEIKDFKVEFPNAEPLKKKVGTEPIQPDLGSGGTASASAVQSTESEGGLFAPIYMGKTKIDEEEVDVVKRGRNANSGTVPKNVEPLIYRRATGFESLVGYLYLERRFDRLNELIALILDSEV